MKIKFLSFIASLFMVSFVITSCLDDDNNIEYKIGRAQSELQSR